MGCQTKIAATILDRGANYLLAVKDNQPALHDDIKRYFDDAPPNELECFQTTDADHGRIEIRRHVVSHKLDWLAGDSRLPGIKTIAMVENRVERNGETSCERRYYICSAVLLALLVANAVRCHRPHGGLPAGASHPAPTRRAEDEHPLHIPRHGHKAPLAADTVDPAQQELAKAQHRLDDAEHRLRHLLAQRVELLAVRGLQLMRHGLERRGVLRCRRRLGRSAGPERDGALRAPSRSAAQSPCPRRRSRWPH